MKLIALLITSAFVFLFSCSPKTTPTGTTITIPKITTEAAAGLVIYTAKCGKCHELKKVDNYTAAEWVPILDAMAPKANLDSTEKANVHAYVQALAKAG